MRRLHRLPRRREVSAAGEAVTWPVVVMAALGIGGGFAVLLHFHRRRMLVERWIASPNRIVSFTAIAFCDCYVPDLNREIAAFNAEQKKRQEELLAAINRLQLSIDLWKAAPRQAGVVKIGPA
jgi:hypothetical protein